MKLLEDRIKKEGTYLGNGILKVDGFVNHQVDPVLMDEAGKVFADIFKDIGATKILTAEISGIAPAVATGLYMNIPVVYARKRKPVTMPDQVFLTLAPDLPPENWSNKNVSIGPFRRQNQWQNERYFQRNRSS